MESLQSSRTGEDWSGEMERISHGDQAALGRLYDRFARPLYSVAYKMLSNPVEAEEAVQDVFVSVWKSASSYQAGKAQIFTWLTVMVRNKCLDRLRAKARRIPGADVVSETAQEREVKEESRTAADAMMDSERSGIIRGAIEKLPEEQKGVIDLAFFTGLSHSEIADRLGLSIGTIKSRIRYGMQKLKLMLGGAADA